MNFLYYHAMELFLKGYLSLHGSPEQQLREIGHDLAKLQTECQKRGLALDDEDVELMETLATKSNVIKARYLEIGYSQVPSIEALDRTGESLRQKVRAALKAAGVGVR